MPRAPFHLPGIKRALAAAENRELRSCDLARAVDLKDSTLLLCRLLHGQGPAE